jgi:octaprenyl-diphosphate synthase
MGFSKIGQTLTALEILELVKKDLERVEHEISLESVASVEAVTAIGRYLQAGGGKRLRPILVLLASKLMGGVTDGSIRMAAVVEMIHTATLVHDDVIDIAETRRGRASPNAVWGNHTCVLAGDWLYMQAFQIALRERNFHVLDLLIALTQMMVEGELLQLERIGKIDISEADYMELVDRKTASLFSACTRLGAMMGGAGEATEARLGEFSWNLGIAFQLVDDVLDFTSHEKVLGKPVGSDLREGKVTLPLIYALEHATAEERQLVATVLQDGNYDRAPFARIKRMIEQHCGFERVRERAQAFTDKARAIVIEFPESPYQRALTALTDLVTDRDH